MRKSLSRKTKAGLVVLALAVVLMFGMGQAARAGTISNLVIAHDGGVVVGEGGQVDTYTLALKREPTVDEVILDLSAEGPIAVNPSSVTFTKETWATPQTVTVSAVDDFMVNGPRAGTITHTRRDNGNTATMRVEVADNDVAGILLSPSAIAIKEGGLGGSYTVALSSQPSGSVTVTATPSERITLSGNTLTFTESNWNDPQAIAVAAVDDTDIEGGYLGAIAHEVSSADPDYNGISGGVVTIKVTDNDSPPPLEAYRCRSFGIGALSTIDLARDVVPWGASLSRPGVTATPLSVLRRPTGDTLYIEITNGLDRPLTVIPLLLAAPAKSDRSLVTGPSARPLLPGETRIMRFEVTDGLFGFAIGWELCDQPGMRFEVLGLWEHPLDLEKD